MESDENKSPLPFQEVVGIALRKELMILRTFCIIYFKEFPHVSNIEIIKINHLSCLFGDFCFGCDLKNNVNRTVAHCLHESKK